MADDGILGLLGRLNDPNALYQGALSDPATQQAMAGRGLLAMAGSFADSAMPTRMPTPLGAVLGHAAGALGTSQDAIMDARLKAAQAQLAGSTVGLQNMLGPAYLAQIEAARQRAAGEAPGGGIPSPPAPGATIPFDPKLPGSDNLNNLAQAAAPTALPPGYTVKMTSGDRPGATVEGTGGPSQHATANAADFKIFAPDGKEIANTGPDTTGYYGKLALTMRRMASPDIKPWLAWGGNFGTGGAGSPPDLMHFDLAGDRGHLGTLAAMEQTFGAQKQPPGGGGATAFGAPSTVRASWFGNAPGWTDKTDRGIQANGLPVSAGAGIALPIPKDSPDFGKWYDVTAPNGQTLRLQQTDVGPGPEGKGRLLDVNAVAAGHFGYTPSSFPTDGSFRVAPAGARPPGAGQIAAAPGLPGGLLNVPDLTGRMNAPIQGIPSGVTPGAPGPAPPAAAAAGPPSAGDILTALSQRTQAAGGPGSLPPGLPQMADASGKVPIPAGPPPGPAAPNLVPGGASLLPPGLLGGGAAAPPGPPPQVAAGPPSGLPPPLVTPPGQPAPAPPITQPQPPPPAAVPTGGPPVAPTPLNLPLPPPMPGGAMGPPVQPTPDQMIAQGIVGISALIGKPAPEYMQRIAGQPIEMQMEAYKAYVQASANQMTEKYKKEIEVAAAGTIKWLQNSADFPFDIARMTEEQRLKLNNEMLTQHSLVPDGKGSWKIDPAALDAVARKAAAQASGPAQYNLIDYPLPDPATGQMRPVKMRADQASAIASGASPGSVGIPGYPVPGAPPGAPGAAAPGTPGTAGAGPGTPGAGLPLLGPEQEAVQRSVGETMGKEYAGVVDQATASMKAKPYLVEIEQALQTMTTPGTGTPEKLSAWKAVQAGLQTIGIPISKNLQDWIASGEIINKAGNTLGFELARTLGAHEAASLVNQAISSNPGLQTSLAGNKALIGMMSSIIDRAQAQRAFFDDWYPTHNNSYRGAQTEFNRQNPWEVVISKSAPYQIEKLGKDEAAQRAAYDKLLPGVTVQGADGRIWIKAAPGQKSQGQ